MTIEFKFKQGDIVKTKLGVIGMVDTLSFKDVQQYFVVNAENRGYWWNETDLTKEGE